MNITNESLKTIHDAFLLFSELISDEKLCAQNGKVLSHLAYQIDVYALATILNFFNNNPETAREREQSNLLIIRMFSLVTAELSKFLTNDGLFDIRKYNEPNNYNDIVSLRNKIHQFRYNEFKKNIKSIDDGMGRSRNKAEPHLDICLKYMLAEEKVLVGTNIYQYHFTEAKEQVTINFMQEIVRAVESLPIYEPADFVIKKRERKCKYKWEVYCYTDIVENAKVKNQRILDRLILAFDDLCSLSEFFNRTIVVATYLKQAPYLMYYFCKMTAIILDETFDNLNGYINNSPDDCDRKVISSILNNINPEFVCYCKKLRNNLHYGQQEVVVIGKQDDIYLKLQEELDVVETLIYKIREAINIYPSETKLRFYRFLRWVQMPTMK